MVGQRLTRSDMLRLFDLLNAELAIENAHGELYPVGGAMMCLALDARHATQDVDGYFRPTGVIRQAAGRVAAQAGVPEAWLNDAVFAKWRGSASSGEGHRALYDVIRRHTKLANAQNRHDLDPDA